MSKNIAHYYATADGKVFDDYDRCWDYARRRWYPNIQTFTGEGMESWRISSTANAIVNTKDELDFLREGLAECDCNSTNMPYGEVGPNTWIALSFGYEGNDEFLVIPENEYKNVTDEAEELMGDLYEECDLMKILRS